jgi:threonine dehydrogenase-like Zn-dependent dehydrogenase
MNQVMAMVAQKQLLVEDLVTTKQPLVAGVAAFNQLCSPDCKDIKVVLTHD